MSNLVIVEHDNHTIKPCTLHTITAASQLAGEVTLLVAGYQCQAVVTAAQKIQGVAKVLHCDHAAYEHQLAENIAGLVLALADGFTGVLASASTTGKNLMPRVAALLDVGQISDITAVVDDKTFLRPIYAGNAFAKVVSQDPVQVITVRSTGFEAASASDSPMAQVETHDHVTDLGLSQFVEQSLTESERPDLTDARVIVSGGRGLASGENFAMLETLADKLGGAVGASRAAVDAGYVPNDYQVGQTGKIVAPDLYIAVGISGAIQHLAGMKDSKVIVAINKDEDAPIFQVADYGLVGDLFTLVPELTHALEN